MKSFLATQIAPFLLQLFVRFVYLTSRKVFHHPIKLDDAKYIIAFWHGELMMQPFNYHKLKPDGKVSAMISDHKDGEAITRTVRFLGIHSIRGSSTKGGVRALIGAIKELKSGDDIAITPDGPKGPRHTVADGIVAIAQKANAKVLAFNCQPKSYWEFKSWDKFKIPKPFGTLVFFVSEPIDLAGMDSILAKELIRAELLKHVID